MWRRALIIDVRDRSEMKGIPKSDKFSGASGLMVLQVQIMDRVMSQECNPSYPEIGVDSGCGYHREVTRG